MPEFNDIVYTPKVISPNGDFTNVTAKKYVGDGSSLTGISRDFLNVKEYGAKGDGKTNDTKAINDTLTAASLASGEGVNTVYFPSGTYMVTSSIIFPSNIAVKGDIAKNTIIKMDKSVGRMEGLGIIGEWDTTTENVIIEDITFDFNTERWHGYENTTTDYDTTTLPRGELVNYTPIYSQPKTGSYSIGGVVKDIKLLTAGDGNYLLTVNSQSNVATTGGSGSGMTVDITYTGEVFGTGVLTNGGSGYTSGTTYGPVGTNIVSDTDVTGSTPAKGKGLTLNITTNGSGEVISVSKVESGSGYLKGDEIEINGDNAVGSGAKFPVQSIKGIVGVIDVGNSGGTDYKVGDVITVSGGGGTGCTFEVSSVEGTLTVPNHGFEVGESVDVDYTSGSAVNGEIKVRTVTDNNTFTVWTEGLVGVGDCVVKAVANATNRNALTIYNSKYVTLNRVRCLHGQRHSLDITSSFRRGQMGVGSTFAAYYDSAITYMHKGAQYITVNDCYFTGAGDDNLTTHFSSDILITNCISESPRGGYSTVDSGGPNTNCFEIDDGSRNVQMYNCRAYKGNQGVEIKAHGYAPAPYNVIVDGMEIINCVGGVECHHSGWRTQTRASETAWRANGGIDNATVPTALQATYAAGKLTSLSDNGYSATANTVTLSNIQIIAPCDQTFKKMGDSGKDKDADTSRPQRAFELGSYDGVVVNNLTISDGSKDRAYTIDGYQPNSNLVTNHAATGSNGYVMHLHNSVRNWTMNNVTINGFFSNSAGTKKGADTGIRIVSNIDEGFVINNLTISDGPAKAIYQTGSDGRFVGTIDNYTVYQTNTLTDNTTWNALSADNQYAFRLNQSGIRVGKGNIIGYGSQGSTISEVSPMWFGTPANDTQEVPKTTWTTVTNLTDNAIDKSNGGWNSTTGVFTVPSGCGGMYYLYGITAIDDIKGDDVVRTGFSKNGASPPVFAESRLGGSAYNDRNISSGMYSQVVSLAEGDTISMQTYHNENDGSVAEYIKANRTNFGGYRISS